MLQEKLNDNDFHPSSRWLRGMTTRCSTKHSASLRFRFRVVGLALVLAVAVFGLSSCTSSAQPTPAPLPLVQTTTVKPTGAELYSEYPAQTYARDQVEVRGRVDGYIERWLFRPGQQVNAGQPLYVLDLRPYRAQLERAQGSLTQAEAELVNAERQTSLQQAEANLTAARAALTRAQRDHERLKPLVEQDAAAQQDLDAALAALRSAESNVKANEAAVAQARLNTETLAQTARGRVQEQRGALKTASLNVQYGTITAPISGVIGDTQVSVGGLVNANSQQPLTTIVPLDPIWVRFKLSESEYANLHTKVSSSGTKTMTLELLLASGNVFPHRGTIENTLNQVDPRTGTIEVQARFPNPERTVLPGQFGRVRFPTERREGALLVPQRAIQQNQSIETVFVVGPDNKIQSRPVTTGPRVGDDWIIDRGLHAGDRVVVEGLLSVRPGLVVQPVPYRQDPQTAAAGAAKGD